MNGKQQPGTRRRRSQAEVEGFPCCLCGSDSATNPKSLRLMRHTGRKVVPITRGERKNAQVRSELTAPVKEEIRILTCRQTSASMTFHLGPPLLLRHSASKPHAQGTHSCRIGVPGLI